MEAHYFDLETYSVDEKPDPQNDKIISIQFQKIDLKTGEKLSRLQVLKAWEKGEEEILRLIHSWFFKRNPWKFIPVGFNLNFEWRFLSEKFKQYGIDTREIGDFLEEYPQIDLKVFAVMKQGSFIGASLSSISDKQEDGNVIKELYENENFEALTNYIEDEADAFIGLYKKLRDNVDNLI